MYKHLSKLLTYDFYRWVREGTCLDRKGTCSFPTGMHCVPGASTTVHILRWQCKERRTIIIKKRASDTSKPTEEAVVEKRKMASKIKPVSKTSDDVLQRRRTTDELASIRKSADEVTKNVDEDRPAQQRRRKR